MSKLRICSNHSCDINALLLLLGMLFGRAQDVTGLDYKEDALLDWKPNDPAPGLALPKLPGLGVAVCNAKGRPKIAEHPCSLTGYEFVVLKGG